MEDKPKEINEEKSEISLDEFYKYFGWEDNPFRPDIPKDVEATIVGFDQEIIAVRDFIAKQGKFGLITGAIGAGKSTILKYIEEHVKEQHHKKIVNSIYSSGAIDQKEMFYLISKPLLNFFTKNSYKNETLHTFGGFLNKKLNDKHLILLIDEAQDLDPTIYDLFRRLTQEAKITIIVAGTELMHNNIPDSLYDRSKTSRGMILDIQLSLLDLQLTRELIEKRIAYVGGQDIEPFTEKQIEDIQYLTKGQPRRVIIEAGELAYKIFQERALGKKEEEKASTIIRNASATLSYNLLKNHLTKTELKVLHAVNDNENCNINKITEVLPDVKPSTIQQCLKHMSGASSKYKDSALAISKYIPLVERKGAKKSATYNIHPTIKPLLAKR